MSPADLPVGIDLGTTYCAVAVVDETGAARVLHNSDGQTTTPSVVLFEPDGAVVGQQAKLQRAAFSDDVVEFVKRQMGRPDWRYVDRHDHEYGAEAISAIILKRLVADASLALDRPVTRAVITVPAYFDESQRTATRHAGTMAGIDVLAVVNEPTAAAVSFGVDHEFTGTVLVYDLGGGTFDVTVLRIGAGQLDIIRSDGDRNLGGFDFDNAIIEWAKEQMLQRAGTAPDDPTDLAQLRERAEQAKHRLTVSTEAPIYVGAGSRTEKLLLTRTVFEQITASLLHRTELLVEEVLEAAELEAKDLDKVLLVGGSTRMPMVPTLVERMLGRSADRSIHPDEAVARGAAVLADLHGADAQGEPRRLDHDHPVTVNDVLNHALGVVTLDVDTGQLRNTVVIEAGSPVPSQRAQQFSTVVDDQTELDVEVTEGADRDLRYVKVLGHALLTVPAYPKGAPVRVALSADVDGILHVEVTDLTTRLELGEFEIDRAFNLDQSEVDTMRDALARLDVQ